MSAISLILNTFLVAAFNATSYANFSIVELDRSIKRQPMEIKENADAFLQIDALWLTLHSHFAWTMAFDTRLFRLNVSRSFWN